MFRPSKIVSGGQTGADRAALDYARREGIPHGGWCPQGRRAEDGRVPPEYNLTETADSDYRERTRRNLQESDGTVIFIDGPLQGESGSAYTAAQCRRYSIPYIVIDFQLWPLEDAARSVRAFVRDRSIKTLNVAGSRASVAPSIALKVLDTLALAFSERPAP